MQKSFDFKITVQPELQEPHPTRSQIVEQPFSDHLDNDNDDDDYDDNDKDNDKGKEKKSQLTLIMIMIMMILIQ